MGRFLVRVTLWKVSLFSRWLGIFSCNGPNFTEYHLLRLVLLSLICATPAQAKVLVASDVIELVRAQDPGARAAEHLVGVLRAQQHAAQLLANPSFSWERDFLSNEGEHLFELALPIDLSSERTTRGHLAGVQVAQAEANAAGVNRHAVERAMLMFYELVAHKRRSKIEEESLARLVEAARVVTRRREEGSASGYEQSRIEIEAEMLGSTLRQTQAQVILLKQGLSALLGMVDKNVTFEDALQSSAEIAPGEKKDSHNATPESLRFMGVAALRAKQARESAAWAWVPSMVVSGGPRLGDGPEGQTGYKLGVALEVPLFARGQTLQERAVAEERWAQASHENAKRDQGMALTRATHVLKVAKQEVDRFALSTENRIESLDKAVVSGYREGRISIVELLDTQKARTRLELHRLQLALKLKVAEVALCAARGDYE